MLDVKVRLYGPAPDIGPLGTREQVFTYHVHSIPQAIRLACEYWYAQNAEVVGVKAWTSDTEPEL